MRSRTERFRLFRRRLGRGLLHRGVHGLRCRLLYGGLCRLRIDRLRNRRGMRLRTGGDGKNRCRKKTAQDKGKYFHGTLLHMRARDKTMPRNIRRTPTLNTKDGTHEPPRQNVGALQNLPATVMRAGVRTGSIGLSRCRRRTMNLRLRTGRGRLYRRLRTGRGRTIRSMGRRRSMVIMVRRNTTNQKQAAQHKGKNSHDNLLKKFPSRLPAEGRETPLTQACGQKPGPGRMTATKRGCRQTIPSEHSPARFQKAEASEKAAFPEDGYATHACAEEPYFSRNAGLYGERRRLLLKRHPLREALQPPRSPVIHVWSLVRRPSRRRVMPVTARSVIARSFVRRRGRHATRKGKGRTKNGNQANAMHSVLLFILRPGSGGTWP